MVAVGQVLNNRYKITQSIYAEKFFEIWFGYDQLLERDIAIKVIVDASNKELIAREARLLAQLEHAHLIPVYDLGQVDNQWFLVMRQVSNTSLAVYLKDHVLSTAEILRLAQRVADALDYLHLKDFVHSNLKASNIMLDEQLLPYLTNFTTVYMDNVERIESARNRVLGTIYNLTPEHFQNKPIDRRSDLYTLGLLLYHCFTNDLVYGRYESFAEKQVTEDLVLPSVREKRPDVPIGVDLVLQRLTHPDPDQRYPSAGEAIQHLNRVFTSGQSDVTGKVFISYARVDEGYVHQLVRELKRIGLDIWIDQDIPPGSSWDKSIENALHTCDKLLLILSPAAVASENVHDEWSYFLEQGKSVYPFLYQPCEMSFRLKRRQYITSTGDLLNDVAQIVDVLAGGVPTALHGGSEAL